MAKVIAKQSGKKGVKGASQNAQQAAAIPYHHAFPVINPMIAVAHTPPDKTRKTAQKITRLRQSLSCSQTHFKRDFIFFNRFFMFTI